MKPVNVLSGNLVDVFHRRIYPARVTIKAGRIEKIDEQDTVPNTFILPGLIDSHIHIESSLLVPCEFARLAVTHGTVATVSDPHEIANVLGIPGIDFMVENGDLVPFKFYFGVPACVPATPFETAGARFTRTELENLFQRTDLHFLSEMMNAPGVINGEPMELEKIALARKYRKPIDGHAPGYKGAQADRYARAGISTDHECTTLQEARDKLDSGMWIQIREGSAARNLEELMSLIDRYPDQVMLCSDDRHPDDLVAGHINQMVKRALSSGVELFKVLRAATLNPVHHYHLDVGLLRPGDPADMITVDSLETFSVLKTVINGNLVAENGVSLLPRQEVPMVNYFEARFKHKSDFTVPAERGQIQVMEVTDGQLITGVRRVDPPIENGQVVPDPQRDILKLTVVNRYVDNAPAVAFVTGFGLRSGAMASSVAHDSHNIVAVGASDADLTAAVNLVIENRGGIALVEGTKKQVLPLPIAGIMTNGDGYEVGRRYGALNHAARELGSPLHAPYMTLSFMALLVIPELKLSDKGLFDGNRFEFTSLFVR